MHAFLDDKHLLDRGLRNYWGYNTLGFFAPEARYASCGDDGGQVDEFKRDGQGAARAPASRSSSTWSTTTPRRATTSGRRSPSAGSTTLSYYRLVEDDPRFYMDYTGTGNTLNARHPQVLQLIMDSLRYWVLEMHVDGFRFDLASALARELHDVDRLSAFFDVIHQDPVLSQVKLIAEPWDVGEGGYQVGNFPVLWAEWNGTYRDTVRGFWRGDERGRGRDGLSPDRLVRSLPDRRPPAVRQHQLRHRPRWLHPARSRLATTRSTTRPTAKRTATATTTTSPGTTAWRARPTIRRSSRCAAAQQRNLLATLLLSQGVPMICGGDEIGRTQHGNNNAYCQDNEISWLDWELDDENRALLEFTRRLAELRHRHPNLRRPKFFQGRTIRGTDVQDLTWLRPDGEQMTDEEWNQPWIRTFGMQLAGGALDVLDEKGDPIKDDSLLLLFNAHDEPVPFTVPLVPAVRPAALAAELSEVEVRGWQVLIDTADSDGGGPTIPAGEAFTLEGRSLALLCWSVNDDR